MVSWRETRDAAQSAFSSVVHDVSITYQQVLLQGTGIYQCQDVSREMAEVNSKYRWMQHAYIVQEAEHDNRSF